MRNTRTFSDLDFNFTAHPVTGDLVRKFDEESIKQAVKNLVLTQNYERPFNSDIGSQIRGLLFEPATPMLSRLLNRAIVDTITNYEPRVNLTDVTVTVLDDTNEVNCTIEFVIVNTTVPLSINLALKRTR
jgi:phage baseplate assembly protein W